MLSNIRSLFGHPIFLLVFGISCITISNRIGAATISGMIEDPMGYLYVAIFSLGFFITMKVFAYEVFPHEVIKVLSIAVLIVGWGRIFVS